MNIELREKSYNIKAINAGKSRNWSLKRNSVLYLMLLPMVIILFLFSYVPMYGVIIAFQDFKPVYGFLGSPFVGFKWFKVVFDTPDFYQILFNTLYFSLLKIVFGTVITLGFALQLNEVRNKKYKSLIQTVVYFPNFLSWVITAGIFLSILSTEGAVNSVLHIFGIKAIAFLYDNNWYRFSIIAIDIWKGFGWGSIIYLAAIAGINSELYESAMIDGANRLQQTWYITIPGISPTIVLLSTLSLGGILNAGFEQLLLMNNASVLNVGDVIDTYVYRIGLTGGQFSLSTAVGLWKSVVAMVLITASYKLAYRFSGYRIF